MQAHNDAIKNKGQVFTPVWVVDMLLDAIRYTGPSVLAKKIMEPSFGDGAILVEIASRIIHEGKKSGKTQEEIRDIIGSNIYGVEKEQEFYETAIRRLNELLSAYKIPLPAWDNLRCGDTLLLYQDYADKMDLVVGNPPYVRLHNLDQQYREALKGFQFATGTTDLYIVFYEIGLRMLKNDIGRLCYISPNSFLRNASQRKLRDYMIDQGLLSALYDFGDSKVFDVDTYNCICVLDKNKGRLQKDLIDYREYNLRKQTYAKMLSYGFFREQLKDSTWNLGSDEEIEYLAQNGRRPIKIKNIATVQNGISTNRDSVYIGEAWLNQDETLPYMGKHTDPERLVWFHGQQIESTALFRCIKGSRYTGTMSNTYVLFPYCNKAKHVLFKKSDGTEIASEYKPYTESELRAKFPLAHDYLLEHWEELEARDMEAGADWFVFARSQGLTNIGYKKLVFQPMISKSAKTIDVYTVDEDVVVYSGLYVTIDKAEYIDRSGTKAQFNDVLYEKMLEEVRKTMITEDFHKYCSLTGKPFSGGYVSVSSKVVGAYGTELTSFPSVPFHIPKQDFHIVDDDYCNRQCMSEILGRVRMAHVNMAKHGVTSPKRIEPIHNFVAQTCRYAIGQGCEVYAGGYSFGKEAKLKANFDCKNADICVMKDGEPIGAIAVKLLGNNFKQNWKNFAEGLLGESAQFKGLGIPYHFLYLIPEEALYRENVDKRSGVGTFVRRDVLSQNDLNVYRSMMMAEDPSKRPDGLFLGIYKPFSDKYLNSLSPGDVVDIRSDAYLNGIQPCWSDLSFIKDEDLKQFCIEHSNYSEFIKQFASDIGVDNH